MKTGLSGFRHPITFGRKCRVGDAVMLPPKPPVRAFTAEEIKALRKTLSQTQQQFASQLGVSLRVVQSWEQGQRTPPEDARRKLENALAQQTHLPLTVDP